jgi:hypothetical protein
MSNSLKKLLSPYTYTGTALLVAGTMLSLTASLIFGIVWLTAFGLSMIILGIILIALGRCLPRLSPELARLLFASGSDTMSDLLEELGITTKAIYLPVSMTDGKARALIPLNSRSLPRLPDKFPQQRLITRFGPNPDDAGLLVATPGTPALEMLGQKPGATSDELESALTGLFHGILDMAQSIAVSARDQTIMVELVKFEYDAHIDMSSKSLGSPPAAMVAAVAAEAWGKPVIILSEKRGSGRYCIELRVLSLHEKGISGRGHVEP